MSFNTNRCRPEGDELSKRDLSKRGLSRRGFLTASAAGVTASFAADMGAIHGLRSAAMAGELKK